MKKEKTEFENYIENMKFVAKALGQPSTNVEKLIRSVSRIMINKDKKQFKHNNVKITVL